MLPSLLKRKKMGGKSENLPGGGGQHLSGWIRGYCLGMDGCDCNGLLCLL